MKHMTDTFPTLDLSTVTGGINAGFEPWIGPGKTGHPPVRPPNGTPALGPKIPAVKAGFEPWL